MIKSLVLCPHQVSRFLCARSIGPIPSALKNLVNSNDDVESWIYGLRGALALASDCLQGCRHTTEELKCSDIARQVADKVLECRGPEITEHDDYTRSIKTVDEIPVEDDDEDDTG